MCCVCPAHTITNPAPLAVDALHLVVGSLSRGLVALLRLEPREHEQQRQHGAVLVGLRISLGLSEVLRAAAAPLAPRDPAYLVARPRLCAVPLRAYIRLPSRPRHNAPAVPAPSSATSQRRAPPTPHGTRG